MKICSPDMSGPAPTCERGCTSDSDCTSDPASNSTGLIRCQDCSCVPSPCPRETNDRHSDLEIDPDDEDMATKKCHQGYTTENDFGKR